MGKYHSRQTGSRLVRIADTPHPTRVKEGEAAVLYRQVSGQSADGLSKATRGIKGKNIARILNANAFIFPLAYEHQLERARKESVLENPPELGELVDRLARMDFRSLHGSVVAKVLGVHSVHNSAAVFVDYPDFVEEQSAMTRTIKGYLELPEDFEFQIGSVEPSIAIATGRPKTHQLEQIRGELPTSVDLSYMKRL